jgi:hypothetical protein
MPHDDAEFGIAGGQELFDAPLPVALLSSVRIALKASH